MDYVFIQRYFAIQRNDFGKKLEILLIHLCTYAYLYTPLNFIIYIIVLYCSCIFF